MRRRLSALSLAAVATLAACRDNPLPTTPTESVVETTQLTMATDGCVDQTLTFSLVNTEVSNLIVNLFEGTHEQSAFTMWNNLKKDKLESRPLLNHIDNLTKWTLEKLTEGATLDPDGTGLLNATTGTVRLLDLVFRCSGEVPTQVPTPPPGLDALFQLVTPSETNDQQFNTNLNDAGAFVPQGALDDQTLLVVVRQPPEVTVNTPFPKLGHTVDVALAGGHVKPGQTLTVLFCPLQELPAAVNARAVIAHQLTAVAPGAPVGAGVEYLTPSTRGHISCPHDEASAAWRHEDGFFKQRAMQVAWLAKKAWNTVGPRPLYAGHAAIGGTIGGFLSPLVLVDPYLETEVVTTPISQPLTFGDVTNVTARLRIKDVPANPAVYRGQWVNPDAVTAAVLTMGISAHIDAGAPSATTINATSVANWSFPCVNAGAHVATVNFPETLVPANAPVFGASTASENFSVNQRDLTNTAANKNRVYGDANPPFTGTLVGVQTQCDDASKFTQVYATAATPASDVGPYPITADVTFDEGNGDVSAANYNEINVGATLTITQAPLNISANNKTRAYGDANPPFDGNILGIKNLDAITLTFANSATTLSPVGNYPIVPTAVGARLFNYFIQSTTNGTLGVTPRGLAGAIDNKTKVQGQANPPFTGNVMNIVSGDGFAAIYVSTATTGSAAGDYPITLNLGVAGGSNYSWTGTDGVLTVTPPADPGGVLFGIESSSDGLSMIDATTGAATFLGRVDPDVTKYTTPVAMSTDPTTGFLYAWNNSDGNTNPTQVITGVLLRINPCNGQATQISVANSGVVAGALAVSPTGTMYLLAGSLYEVNKTTGALTTIGPLGGGGSGAEFDASGVLYSLSGTTLVTINTATGAATTVATLSQNMGTIGSIVFTPSGQLMGSAIDGRLFDIDKVTGVVSNIRNVTGAAAPQGMGYAVACG